MTKALSAVRALIQDERGQVLPLVAVAFVLFLGMAGMTMDVGRAYYCSRALQQVVDSVALAGAGSIKTAANSAAAIATANSMNATPGTVNARANLPNVTMASGFPILKCLTTLKNQGMACTGNVPYNAMQVQEQSAVPMYFASLFGVPTMTVTAAATASSRGGAPSPNNIAIVVDTTLSMLSYDSDCGATQIACAMNGVIVLLQTLSPCATSLTSCSINNGVSASSVDRVALFAFPDVSYLTTSADTTCTTTVPNPTASNRYWSTAAPGGNIINFVMPMSPTGATPVTPWPEIPQGMAYSFPVAGAVIYVPPLVYYATYPMLLGIATYQITNYLSDYRTSDKTTALNPNSSLVQAVGGVLGCGSMTTPNYAGISGTYYAGALYAAQSSLVAQQAANPGSGNVIIIISDGDSNAPRTNGPNTIMGPPATSNGQYPSWVGECGQAVVAAQYATSQGTAVYSVAYGAAPVGCTSDLLAGSYPNISPCSTMQYMASAPQYFYSDYHQTGSGSVCVAGQPVVSLSAIFSSIANDLTTARLIPNNTT